MYKPVLPTFLDERKEDDTDFTYLTRVFDNKYLRVGVVVNITEIEDETNVFGLGPEYDVMTVEQNKEGSMSNVLYRNCMRLDAFGGISDYMFAKMRKPKDAEKVKETASMKDQQGSIVLLLCLDGNAEKAIIIGSIAHPDAPKLKKDLGQHLEGEFNGLNWKIDKDGAMTITFRSATDDDGKPQDETAGGSFATITKDGSFDLNTGDDKNYIRIDKPNNDIGLKADDDIGLTAKNDIGFNAGKNLNMNVKKDWIANAEGKAAFTIKSTLDIKADAPMTIGTPQLQIDASNGMLVKSAQIILDAPLVLLGSSPTPALIISTQFLGKGNHGAPVISSPIGPFSSSVFVGV